MFNPASLAFLKVCGLTAEEFAEVLHLHPCPPHLVLGLIKTESGGNKGAMRFEPGYPYVKDSALWAKHSGWTEITERTLQMFSYGLVQIMLATARDRGFGLHPELLFDPKVNVSWGCFHLSLLNSKYGSWQDAIAAYNFGHPAKKLISGKYKNQEYVDRVYTYAAEFMTHGGPKVT